MRNFAQCVSVFILTTTMALGAAPVSAQESRDRTSSQDGLTAAAAAELRRTGLDKYLGAFTPVSSDPFSSEWVRHSFDSQDGDGPICIGGTDYSVFTREGDPDKVMIFLQGGGACWQGVTRCNVTAEAQFPPPGFSPGIFSETSPDGRIENGIGDWSVVYMPYCDGSVFGGDNDVENDPVFGTRRHRGLRNLSAGMDVAASVFPSPAKVLVTGSSAGGVGAASFAPFLARFIYGNQTDLYVFNDAGPLALNPDGAPDAALARVEDWKFDQFFPLSCLRQGLCSRTGQQTGIIEWRLENDRTIHEAFYSTDADGTNRGFASLNVPGSPPVVPVPQSLYRDILDAQHGPIHEAFPERYKRFIVSGGNYLCGFTVALSHTAAQGGNLAPFGCPMIDLYYDLEVEGIPLWKWVNGFVNTDAGDVGDIDDDDDDLDDAFEAYWVDVVEPYIGRPDLNR